MEVCHSVCKLTETVTLLLMVSTLPLVGGDKQWPLSPDVLNNLPPCELVGFQLKHPDVSCIFISKSMDETTRNSLKTTDGAPDSRIKKVKGDKADTAHGTSDDEDRNFWIAPPFLIGASSVLGLYILIHCVYIHCYASKKIKQLKPKIVTPAIVLADKDSLPSTSIQMTPVISYNDGGPKRIDGHPSLVFYHAADSETSLSSNQDEDDTRRKRSNLRFPDFFNARVNQSSKGEPPKNKESYAAKDKRSQSSICIVPSVIWGNNSSFAKISVTSEDKAESIKHVPILILPNASSYVSIEHGSGGRQLNKEGKSAKTIDEKDDESAEDNVRRKQDMLTEQRGDDTSRPSVTIQIGGD